jgi:hypothetical protein
MPLKPTTMTIALNTSTPKPQLTNLPDKSLSVSSASSPFTPAHEKQCQGFIQSSGLRCKRTVKNATAINALGVELRYCHQHLSQLPKNDANNQTPIPTTPSSLSVGNVSGRLLLFYIKLFILIQ